MLSAVLHKLEPSNAVSYEIELSSVILDVRELLSVASGPENTDGDNVGSRWSALLKEADGRTGVAMP